MEWIFVFLAFFFGMIMIMIEPPMASPDENVHFYNAYALSTGQIFPKNRNGVLTHTIPQNYVDFVSGNNSHYSGKLDEKESFQEAYYNSWLTVDTEDKAEITYWSIDTNPAGYIFSALGMLILRVVSHSHATVTNLIMAGKMVNLLFYVIVIFWAIRLTPKYKNTLFILSLMPMALYQGASISYDAVLFPICFFLLAYILSILYRKTIKVEKRDIAVFLVVAFFLSGIKPAYAFLLLTLFVFPKTAFSGKKQRTLFALLIIIIFAITFGGYICVVQLLGAETTAERVIMLRQAKYFFSNPLQIFSLVKNSFAAYKSFYVISFIGNLGQLDTCFPFVFYLFEIAGFLIVFLYDALSNSAWNAPFAGLSLGSCFLIILILFTALYLQWTPLMQGIGGNSVDGIQGRYFIPIAPYIVASIPGIRRNQWKKTVEKAQPVMTEVSLLLGSLGAASTAVLLLLRFK